MSKKCEEAYEEGKEEEGEGAPEFEVFGNPARQTYKKWHLQETNENKEYL